MHFFLLFIRSRHAFNVNKRIVVWLSAHCCIWPWRRRLSQYRNEIHDVKALHIPIKRAPSVASKPQPCYLHNKYKTPAPLSGFIREKHRPFFIRSLLPRWWRTKRESFPHSRNRDDGETCEESINREDFSSNADISDKQETTQLVLMNRKNEQQSPSP